MALPVRAAKTTALVRVINSRLFIEVSPDHEVKSPSLAGFTGWLAPVAGFFVIPGLPSGISLGLALR
jgi:hypothetical protein